MNGDTTGLVSADASSSDDPERRLRHALRAVQLAAAFAAAVHEHKLQREAEDAAGRLFAQLETLIREGEVQQRRLDGENPQDAGQKEEVTFR